MKRILSAFLAVVMILAAIPISYATTSHTNGTKVQYVGQGQESYFITVPATLKPGGSGTVTLKGTWANNRIVNVSADETVTLTNNIDNSNEKVLNVNFAGMSYRGNNTVEQTFTEGVSVDSITNALFGVWSGKFNYNVSIESAAAEVLDGLFDSNGVQLASYDELVNTYNLSLFFDSHNAIDSSTQTIGYLLDTYPELSTGTKLVVGEGVTEMENYSLSTGLALTEVILPSTLKRIGHFSFNVSAEEIILPEGLEYVGYYTFVECDNLKTLTIPNSVTETRECMIAGCDSLESLYLGDNIEYLQYYTATDCIALKEITIGANTKYIDYSAFYGCPNVEKVYFNGTVEEWNNIELYQNYQGIAFNLYFTNTNLNQVICKDGVTCITHTGEGDTTCSTKPICEVCGYGFGVYKAHDYVIDENPTYKNKDEYEHYVSAVCNECGYAGFDSGYHDLVYVENGEVSIDPYDGHRVETKCTICSETIHMQESHYFYEPTSNTYLDENYHLSTYVCELCGYSDEWSNWHNGGTNDCSTLSICDECGHGYGEYGDHNIVGDTCTICGVTGYVIETSHYPSWEYPLEYTQIGTWDFSDAKSVDLIVTYNTNGNIYGDKFYITEGLEWEDGRYGSCSNDTRRYLLRDGGIKNVILDDAEDWIQSYAGFFGSKDETVSFNDVDFLTGSIIYTASKNKNSYGIKVVIIPNY